MGQLIPFGSYLLFELKIKFRIGVVGVFIFAIETATAICIRQTSKVDYSGAHSNPNPEPKSEGEL